MAQFFDFENLTKFKKKHPNSIAFAYLAARLIEKKEYFEASISDSRMEYWNDGIMDC